MAKRSELQPALIEDWPQRILDAHEGLMDSPGHRRNIMDPYPRGRWRCLPRRDR